MCWLSTALALQVCGRLDGEESMLLCDGCDRGCHLHCGRLESMPHAPSWHCADCERCTQEQGLRQQQQQHSSRKRLTKLAPALSDESDLSSDSEDFKEHTARKVLLPTGHLGWGVLLHLILLCRSTSAPLFRFKTCRTFHGMSWGCLCLPLQAVAGDKMQLFAAERRLKAAQDKQWEGEEAECMGRVLPAAGRAQGVRWPLPCRQQQPVHGEVSSCHRCFGQRLPLTVHASGTNT